MAVKVQILQGGGTAAGTADLTDWVPQFDSESTPLFDAGMQCNNGGACQYQFIVLDDENIIGSGGTAPQIGPHNVTIISEDAPGYEAWLARGRVSGVEGYRYDKQYGDAVAYTVTSDDANVDLRGLALREAWVRGSESGRARVLALVTAFLTGDPRVTTVIDDHLVASGGEVTMPAKTYPAGTNLTDILDDCAETEGKIYSVVIHHQSSASHLCLLYIDESDHSTYASTLSITDTSPNLTTSFPPIWDQGPAFVSDAQEVVHGMVSRYGVDDASFVISEDTSKITSNDYWLEPYNDSVSQGTAQATARIASISEGREISHVTHQVTIKIPASKVDLLAAGMSIGIRSAASMGGGYLGTTQTRRIAQLKWEQIAPEVGEVEGHYYAHMQLDRPQRVVGTGPGLPVGPKPPTQPTAGSSLRLYHSAHLAGNSNTAEAQAAPNLGAGNLDSGWEGNNGGAFDAYMLYDTPAGTINGAASWAAVNAAAGQYAMRSYLYRLSGDLLDIIQSGGTVRMQAKASARYGIGISESAQNNVSAWCIRVYRPSTSSFVGTAVAVSSGGSLKFPAQATQVNRLWSATLSAVAGAQSGDYIVVEVGTNHIGPTSGGTGAGITFTDNKASDLPEDELETGALNSWIEFSGTGGGGDTTQPIVNPGEESVGTDSDTYAPLDHTHAHGYLAGDGVHLHDDDQVIQRHTNESRDPDADDDTDAGYRRGWTWVNDETGEAFILTDSSAGAAVWESITAGSGMRGDMLRAHAHGLFLAACHESGVNTPHIIGSLDGKTFEDVSGAITTDNVSPTYAGDPTLLHWNGYYWLLHQYSTGDGQGSFTVLRSENLTDWTEVTEVAPGVPGEVSVYPGAWARNEDGTPYLDPTDGRPRLFLTVSTTLPVNDGPFVPYELHPTNDAMSAWSTAVEIDGDFPADIIDPFVIKHGDEWAFWYKSNDPGDEVIEYATSATLTGTYVVQETGDWAGWGTQRENPSLVKLDDGTWRIYIQKYTNLGTWWSESTDDWATWSAETQVISPFADDNDLYGFDPIFIPGMLDHMRDPNAHADVLTSVAPAYRWVPVSIDPAGDEAWEILFDDDGSVVMMEVYD